MLIAFDAAMLLHMLTPYRPVYATIYARLRQFTSRTLLLLRFISTLSDATPRPRRHASDAFI